MSTLPDKNRLLPVGVRFDFNPGEVIYVGGIPNIGMVMLDRDGQAYTIGVAKMQNFIPQARTHVVCKDCGHHAPPTDNGCANCWSENITEDARVKNQEAQGKVGELKNYGVIRARG